MLRLGGKAGTRPAAFITSRFARNVAPGAGHRASAREGRGARDHVGVVDGGIQFAAIGRGIMIHGSSFELWVEGTCRLRQS